MTVGANILVEFEVLCSECGKSIPVSGVERTNDNTIEVEVEPHNCKNEDGE